MTACVPEADTATDEDHIFHLLTLTPLGHHPICLICPKTHSGINVQTISRVPSLLDHLWQIVINPLTGVQKYPPRALPVTPPPSPEIPFVNHPLNSADVEDLKLDTVEHGDPAPELTQEDAQAPEPPAETGRDTGLLTAAAEAFREQPTSNESADSLAADGDEEYSFIDLGSDADVDTPQSADTTETDEQTQVEPLNARASSPTVPKGFASLLATLD